MTTFLNLIRRRFTRECDVLGDFVPWHLDDKATAYAYVRSVGGVTPGFWTFPTAAAALAWGMENHSRFVLKESGRHSSQGVYLIEVQADGSLIDYQTLSHVTLESIQAKARSRDGSYWLVEEWLDSGVAGRPIPLDYKFYLFRDQVALVIQIDRNTQPPRVALFDGAWIPLEYERHFTFDQRRWRPGHHVLPRHASAMMTLARRLGKDVGTKFVSVDCYDGVDGPVFGEFTFTPGAPDVGMIAFRPDVLAQLDRGASGSKIEALSGFSIDLPRVWKAMSVDKEPVSPVSQALFALRSAAGANSDRRYARLFEATPGVLGRHYTTCVSVAGVLLGDKERALLVGKAAMQRSGFFNGQERGAEMLQIALDAYASGDTPWARTRHAEARFYAGDQDARKDIQAIAQTGYEYAQRLLQSISASKA